MSNEAVEAWKDRHDPNRRDARPAPEHADAETKTVIAAKPTVICGCFGDIPGGHKTAEANARLIAAAPELLDALRKMVAVNDSIPTEEMTWTEITAANEARALLTKLDNETKG